MKRKFAKLIILYTGAYFSFPKLKAKSLLDRFFQVSGFFHVSSLLRFLIGTFNTLLIAIDPYLKFLSNK